jgi:protein-disulfide isomerase
MRRASRVQRQSYIILGAIALGVVAVVIAIAALSRGGSNVSAEIVVPTPRPAGVAQSGHTYGDPNAPVTIDEYVDFQCPFCEQAVVNVMPVIDQQYVENGTVKIVAHPIAILGDESVQAAAAAEAANEQGKFWAFFDALYANQGAENSGAFSNERLVKIAEALGLDMSAFHAVFDNGVYTQQVIDTTQGARSAGVSSTPTILVNGVKVNASVDAISAAIEAAAGS